VVVVAGGGVVVVVPADGGGGGETGAVVGVITGVDVTVVPAGADASVVAVVAGTVVLAPGRVDFSLEPLPRAATATGLVVVVVGFAGGFVVVGLRRTSVEVVCRLPADPGARRFPEAKHPERANARVTARDTARPTPTSVLRPPEPLT
jgi:hypothetical protein